MRCLNTARGAPDLEMNGVKVQVQHIISLFHPAPVTQAQNASDPDMMEFYIVRILAFLDDHMISSGLNQTTAKIPEIVENYCCILYILP